MVLQTAQEGAVIQTLRLTLNSLIGFNFSCFLLAFNHLQSLKRFTVYTVYSYTIFVLNTFKFKAQNDHMFHSVNSDEQIKRILPKFTT